MNYKRGFVVPAVAYVVLAVLAVGVPVYFYVTKPNAAQNVATNLPAARAELNIEKEKLDSMKESFLAQNLANKVVSEQFGRLQKFMYGRVDFLFLIPNSNTPKLKFDLKDASLQRSLEEDRLKVSAIIKYWKNIFDNIYSVKLGQDDLTKMKEDMEFIAEFVDKLDTAVENLSTSGGGLSQADIAQYDKVTDESVDEIKNILDAFTDPNLYTPDSVESSAGSSVNTNITVGDIAEQESVVTELADKVVALEELLPNETTPTPTPTINSSSNTNSASSGGSSGNSGGNTQSGVYTNDRFDFDPSAPRLLQGTGN